MKSELKPCPFCGEDADMEKRTAILNDKFDELNSYVQIICRNGSCGAAVTVEAEYNSVDQKLEVEKGKVVRAWNRRLGV